MSAKFRCRLRCGGKTLLAFWCVNVVGQPTLVVCILPGTDTEVMSVFLLVEIWLSLSEWAESRLVGLPQRQLRLSAWLYGNGLGAH